MLFNTWRNLVNFDSEGAPSGGDQKSDEPQTGDPLKYEDWIAKQNDDVKGLLDGHTKALKGALDSERESRKGLEKQVRELASKAEKGSQAQTDLEKLANDLAAADSRAEFYEKAHGAGITNLKLAYLIAMQDDLIDKRGNVNFEAMRNSYPELFAQAKKTPPPSDAGAGNGQNGTQNVASMNNFIRAAAGRKITS